LKILGLTTPHRCRYCSAGVVENAVSRVSSLACSIIPELTLFVLDICRLLIQETVYSPNV